MYTKQLKIGILGSGTVAQVLAKGFITEGHPVMMGTRIPVKKDVVDWQKTLPTVQVGSFSEAAQYADIIILAAKGAAILDVLKLAGPEQFTGKVVIDVTNPISADPPINGVLKFFTRSDESLMEQIQAVIPGAYVVKAFNSIGSAFMYKPAFGSEKPTMFICGDNEEAKKTVTGILYVFGWEAEDMGSSVSARPIEQLCILWCLPGFLSNQWTHAFKLLKR
ncbi:MAG TPA: NAD(P)-binding domain-containing protein [Flavitalea sp.]|nr:NAD(P)-binding domain-containing protein [Flavitalea sp.]